MKLMNINKKGYCKQNKTYRDETKLSDHITLYTKQINDLSREVKLIST